MRMLALSEPYGGDTPGHRRTLALGVLPRDDLIEYRRRSIAFHCDLVIGQRNRHTAHSCHRPPPNSNIHIQWLFSKQLPGP